MRGACVWFLLLDRASLVAQWKRGLPPPFLRPCAIAPMRRALRCKAEVFGVVVNSPRAVDLAGYVDSCTFLALFGLFVAQVTGSFVLADAKLVTGDQGVVVIIDGLEFRCSFSPASQPLSWSG
jgi:hypothetical protein